jgi:hypothetical protein
MTGNLDAEQKNRLHEIAERCPVRRSFPKLISERRCYSLASYFCEDSSSVL